ncbi:MAG: transposase [Rhodospirillales bacterium]|nr:transposase [Rhodospirillales bacterium]
MNLRDGLNAVLYVHSTGGQWQALPNDLPPKSTARGYRSLWDRDGTIERIHHALYVGERGAGRGRIRDLGHDRPVQCGRERAM